MKITGDTNYYFAINKSHILSNLTQSLLISIIPIIFVCLFQSCANEKKTNDYEKVLGGKHELRKFNVKQTTTNSSSAFYFLVMGGYSQSSSTRTTVRFYFMNYKCEYQLMELYMQDVNIKIDSTVTTPYVKFYYRNNRRTEAEWSAMYEYDITKAVIYCKESDFQPEININDLK